MLKIPFFSIHAHGPLLSALSATMKLGPDVADFGRLARILRWRIPGMEMINI